MTSHEGVLYYGTRTHQVRRMSLAGNRMEALSPFEPPHMDTVMSLAVVNGYLVSGSKDKNLRLWSFDGANTCTVHAFNDYVNVVYSHLGVGSGAYFYSGSRDGQVKIGRVLAGRGEERIEFVGGIMAHSQSVNDICGVGQSGEELMATCSTDRSVKIWRPDSSTLERMRTE